MRSDTEGVREVGEGGRISTHSTCVSVCGVRVCGVEKYAVTNMFVSMRQSQTALSRRSLWVVYKKICHISQSSAAATLQHSALL